MKRRLLIFVLLAWSGMALAYRPVPPVPMAYPYLPAPAFLPPPLPPPPAYPAPAYPAPRMPLPAAPYVYHHPAYVPWAPRPAAPQRRVERVSPAPSPAVAEDVANPAPSNAAVSEEEPRKRAKPHGYQREFLAMLLPIVQRENARLLELRQELGGLLAALERGEASEAQRRELQKLARRYRVKGKVLADAQARRNLLQRVDTIPEALALAQAANESAWGTSRFAREGNNLFGIWTYDQDKGIVPKGRPEGARYLVRRFDSVDESVRYYLFTLNSHPAYQPLRDARAKAREQGAEPSAMRLAVGLVKYSAKGERYVALIRELITRYQLAALAQENRQAG